MEKKEYDELIKDIAAIIAEKDNIAELAGKFESVLLKIEKIESLAMKYASDRIKED